MSVVIIHKPIIKTSELIEHKKTPNKMYFIFFLTKEPLTEKATINRPIQLTINQPTNSIFVELVE